MKQMNRRFGQTSIKWVVMVTMIGAAAVAGLLLIAPLFRVSVTVTQAVRGPVVEAFYSTGTISPQHEFDIRTSVAGTLEVLVDKGDSIKTDQVLARVVDPDLRYQLDKAAAELRQRQQLADETASPVLQEYRDKLSADQDMLGIAQRAQQRIADSLAKSAASQNDLDDAIDRTKTMQSQVDSIKSQMNAREIELQADVAVAQAARDKAQALFDRQTLRSPIDGVVLDRPVSAGTRLAVNDHIMQVADVRPANLVMRAQVDEEDKIKLRAGQTVQMSLYAFGGTVRSGKVSRVYDKADPDRRTYEVDVALDAMDDRLAAGMTGELAFIIAQKESALVIPAQALQNGAVWRVADAKLETAAVTVGLRSVERIEIVSGLSPGDRIVISALHDPQPGQSVRTNEIDPVIAAGLNKPKDVTGVFQGFSN